MGFFSFLLGVFFTAFMIGIIINSPVTFYFGAVGMATVVLPIMSYALILMYRDRKQRNNLR